MSETLKSSPVVCEPDTWPPKLPPAHHGRITIATYNTLRRHYEYRDQDHVEKKHREWEPRLKALRKQINSLQADLILLQETELRSLDEDFGDYFDKLGYGFVHADPKGGVDFVKPLIFFKRDMFKIRWHSPRSRIILLELEIIKTGHVLLIASCHFPSSHDYSSRFGAARSLLKKFDTRRGETNPNDLFRDRSVTPGVRSRSRGTKHRSKSPSRKSGKSPWRQGRRSAKANRTRDYDSEEKKDPMEDNPLRKTMDIKTADMLFELESRASRKTRAEMEKSEEVPHGTLCIVAGDFNATKDDPAYILLNNGTIANEQWDEKKFGKRPRKVAYKSPNLGPLSDAYISINETKGFFTYQGGVEAGKKGVDQWLIDYILYTKSKSHSPCSKLELKAIRKPYTKAQAEECARKGIPNHWHPSDHFMLAAVFDLPAKDVKADKKEEVKDDKKGHEKTGSNALNPMAF
ncbi:hypothetical protein AAMO2058_000952300 [Amorphochlora amoebiformis]